MTKAAPFALRSARRSCHSLAARWILAYDLEELPMANNEFGARVSAPDRLRTLQSQRGLKLESIQLWATSPELAWYIERRSTRIYRFFISVVLITLVLELLLAAVASTHKSAFMVAVGVLGAMALAQCTVPYWAARRAFLDRKRALAAYRVDVALQKVCKERKENDQLPLAGLFELNRRQLDEYQEMTKRQQLVAFQLTWAAATLAFVVLIGGTVLSFKSGTGSKQYVVGGLTALGTLLSGFLGKTFFEGLRHAMDQLNYYYAEPSMTGRMLAAERVVKKLDANDQAKYTDTIVKSLLSWKPPPAPLRGGGKNASPQGEDTTEGKTSPGVGQPGGKDSAKPTQRRPRLRRRPAPQ